MQITMKYTFSLLQITHRFMHIHTLRFHLEREKAFVDNLHNKQINIKRFMLYFCVTFYSINTPISGFRRLKLPSEGDAVEKYIPTFSTGWCLKEFLILTNKKKRKTPNKTFYNQKSLGCSFCSMTSCDVSLNVIKLEPVRIKGNLFNKFWM